MKRNIGVGVLIVCFGLSSVNISLAADITGAPPVIVAPYNLDALKDQIMEQDRENRDQELAIRNLIDNNQKISDTSAGKQDSILQKINETIVNYSNSLLARDHARIMANEQNASQYSRYGDLIDLIQNVEDSKNTAQTLLLKKDVIQDKYKVLTDLKDEMTSLNQKLDGQDNLKDLDATLEQKNKEIQLLTEKLAEMDQKISRYDQILTEKDEQIAQLKVNLAKLQLEANAKDQVIQQQKNQIDLLQANSKVKMDLPPIVIKAPTQEQQVQAAVNASPDTLNLPPIVVNSPSAAQQVVPAANTTSDTMNLPSIIVNLSNNAKQAQTQTASPSPVVVPVSPIVVQGVSNPPQAASDVNGASAAVPVSPIMVQGISNSSQVAPTLKNTPAVVPAPAINEAAPIALSPILLSAPNALAKAASEAPASTIDLSPINVSTKAVTEDNSSLANGDLIKSLTDQIARIQAELSAKDEIIKEQKNQMAVLKAQFEKSIALENHRIQTQVAAKDIIIKQQDGQIGILKEELNQKADVHAQIFAKDEIIKQQQNQINVLKAQSEELGSKEELIKSQADQINAAALQFRNKGEGYDKLQEQVTVLKSKIQEQSDDLKTKNESIRWLNQVLAVAKNKAQYYQLTSKQDQLMMQQVQGQVQKIKDDFAQHYKDYAQFEESIVSFKSEINHLGHQLLLKQQQIDELKEALQNKDDERSQSSQSDLLLLQKKDQQSLQIQQDLKNQLLDKESQIVKMRADIQAILQDRADKEIYLHHASLQLDDRVKLAQQLTNLQAQETALLEEKNKLAQEQNMMLDDHARALEGKINGLLSSHHIQMMILQNNLEELRSELNLKEQEINNLKVDLLNKISNEKNQNVLVAQIHDLKLQVQDKEDQINTLKKTNESSAATQIQADTFKQQLADQQNKEDLLKQELDSKSAQLNKMTGLIEDYQKKLEDKDSTYNEELGQLKFAQAQAVKVKKEISDLRATSGAEDLNQQALDLNQSMTQQNKINELQLVKDGQAHQIIILRSQLALIHQQLEGAPSPDEVNFLKSGLQEATFELKQKNEELLQVKANAEEYAKEFKEQTQEFFGLKVQLHNVQEDLDNRNEDLKYKNMEIIRIKERMGKIPENGTGGLQAQLKSANATIRDLQAQLSRLKSSSKDDPVQDKLSQALDKIDEQGRIINTLTQKLQDLGQNVDLTKSGIR